MTNLFKRTKQIIHKKKIFGFDIETADDNKTFVCASIFGLTKYKNRYIFKSKIKADIIKELKTNQVYRNSEIYATNIDFDFFGLFFDTDEIGNWESVQRQSKLLQQKTFVVKNEFVLNDKFGGVGKSNNRRPSIIFRDSMNYAPMSVNAMGHILSHIYPDEDLMKRPTPSFIKDINHWVAPSNEYEWEEMWDYNIRDSEITYRFMKWFIPSLESIGGSFKMTSASCAMSLFKCRFLGDKEVFLEDRDVLDELFLGYYGGRTECFIRGKVENLNYYDFNSLYPSVMQENEFPEPTSRRISTKNDKRFFRNCDGLTEVTIKIPEMHIPPLPFRHDDLVLFPVGIFRGYYSNVELRYAESIGCEILEVHRSIYYLLKCRPFKEFVDVLYPIRMKLKAEVPYNPMELVYKLLMNSLYGKFAEKYDTTTKSVHKNQITQVELESGLVKNQIGDYYYLSEEQDPRVHCIPIWAIYVTAYGRIKMHKAMSEVIAQGKKVVYCDTDSIVTDAILPTSKELGELKLEQVIKTGYFIRAKSYMPVDEVGEAEIRMKGIPRTLLTKERFLCLEQDPLLKYTKIAKIKESIRRGLIPNEVIDSHKVIGLEDTKRDWRGKKFTFKEAQESDPLEIQGGKIVRKRQEPHRVANLKANKKPTINNGANSIGNVAPTMK